VSEFVHQYRLYRQTGKARWVGLTSLFGFAEVDARQVADLPRIGTAKPQRGSPQQQKTNK